MFLLTIGVLSSLLNSAAELKFVVKRSVSSSKKLGFLRLNNEDVIVAIELSRLIFVGS